MHSEIDTGFISENMWAELPPCDVSNGYLRIFVFQHALAAERKGGPHNTREMERVEGDGSDFLTP